MLTQWWVGSTFLWIGQQHGITRQRAFQILVSVGCSERHRRHRPQARVPGQRDALRNEVAEAKAMMESTVWFRLTARQRGVVAWLSMGLGTRAIATRTGGTPQSVRNLFTAARWRALWIENTIAIDQRAEPEEDVDVKNESKLDAGITSPLEIHQDGEREPEPQVEETVEFKEVEEIVQEVEPESKAQLAPQRDAVFEPKRVRLSVMQKKKPQRWARLWP